MKLEIIAVEISERTVIRTFPLIIQGTFKYVILIHFLLSVFLKLNICQYICSEVIALTGRCTAAFLFSRQGCLKVLMT